MERRLSRLFAVALLLFGILAVRLLQMQVIQGERYARLSDRNRIREILLPAPRGRILDRDGRVVAETRPSFTCTAVPTELPESVLPLLGTMIGLPPDELRLRIAPVARYKSPVNIKRNLSIEEVARLEENNFRLPGVQVRVDPIRSYPHGIPYAHLLGHIGEATDEDLKADSTLRRLDFVGRSGVESRYERLLRGRDGHRYVEVDARGLELGPLSEGGVESPVPGSDLHLSISDRLQLLAWRLISRHPRGAVVGLDVRTGDIICFVSQPGYDPNLFLGAMDAARWDSMVANPSKPFFNRALASGYPPGSTIKPVVALAALRADVISAGTRFQPCNGGYKYGNRVFRCTGSHGQIDLIDAIAHSCNVYFYQLALRLGLDSLTSHLTTMGLGRPTGIDLPGEKGGSVPDRAWLDHRYGTGKWGAGTLLNFGIGQGEVSTTPLQMAVLYAGIANNGLVCRPQVVTRADSAGRTIYQRRVERWSLPANSSDLRTIRLAMSRVVERGTASSARLREVTIAGKTGTSQNPPRPDHAWFIGYAPAEDPEVCFAVIVENAGHGGAVAAPIVSTLIRAWFFPSEPKSGPDTVAAVSDDTLADPESPDEKR